MHIKHKLHNTKQLLRHNNACQTQKLFLLTTVYLEGTAEMFVGSLLATNDKTIAT